MATLTQAMNYANIETTIDKTEPPTDADKWQKRAYNYRVTFLIRGLVKSNDRSMVVPFSTGYGWDRQPSPAEVMRCVLSDAMTVHPSYGSYRFEEWADDLGYDTDSRKAEATFRTMQEQAYELETLLTRHVLESWLSDDELRDSESTDAPTGRAIKKIKPQDRKF